MATSSGALIMAGSALCAVLWGHPHWSVVDLVAGGLILALAALAIGF